MICLSDDRFCEIEYENMPLLAAYRLHEDGYALIVTDGKVRFEYDI